MYLVNIEFRRIQTFLFSSRRLRDMVGANVLLGEVIRHKLPREVDREAAAVVDLSTMAEPPNAISTDPLGSGLEDNDIDDPRALYRRGILARDGGHFRAVFASDEAAARFRAAAEKLILQELPGLAFDIDTINLAEGHCSPERRAREPVETLPVDAPIFATCQASGEPSAAKTYSLRDAAGTVENEHVSEGIDKRRRAYERFHSGTSTHDVIGLLRSRAAHPQPIPGDFEELCGDDYLAVIHADGNDIGKEAIRRVGEGKPETPGDFVAREAALETFFHRNRASFRAALEIARGNVFDTDGTAQHQLLMLGGDDLLLVCRAKLAFRFAHALAAALGDDPEAPTVGIGVAIGRRTVPFHHLQEVAEALTASAKRLYRRLAEDGAPASVVDWNIETGSWSLDPIQSRQSDLVNVVEIDGRRECCILSRRPLPVLSQVAAETADHRSLEGMMRAASAIAGLVAADDDGKLARSQLRALATALEHGRRWSEFAYAGAPPAMRESLRTSPAIGLTSLWEGSNGVWITAIRDIVEIFEVGRLGAGKETQEGATR